MDDSQIIDCNWVDCCVAPDDRGVARNAFRALLMSGSDEPQSCEYHVRSSDGEDRFITWRGVALRDANNVATGVMLSGEDITDQRRAESEAHRALERMNNVSRLATMGEMAAGISHELNQPLAAIANYAQACVAPAASSGTATCRRSPARSNRSPRRHCAPARSSGASARWYATKTCGANRMTSTS